MLKKRIVALTMAVALVGTAGLAFAGTDLSDPKSDPVSFAVETLPDAVLGVTTMVWPGVSIVGKTGFGADGTADRYYRINLTGGSFQTAPVFGVANLCTLAQGGQPKDAFAIFNCSFQNYDQNFFWSMGLTDLNTTDRVSSVNVDVKQYQTPSDASAQINPIGGTALSGIVATLVQGLAVTAGDVTPLQIDINADEKLFVGPASTSVVGKITADLGDGTATLYSATTGATLNFVDVITAGSMTAVASAFANTAGVYTSVNDTCAPVLAALSQDATDKTKFSWSGYGAYLAGLGGTTDTQYLCYDAAAGKKIAPGPVTGLVTKATPAPIKAFDLGTLSVLELNASTDRLTFALTPSGVYPYYVRITNPDVKTGAVFLTVYNDAGASASFDIATLSTANLGLVAGKLAAGSSTNLIPITDIYAAAQAADASFAVAGGSMKLRIEARAQFGTLPGSSDDVVLNAFTVANDGSTFTMISADSN